MHKQEKNTVPEEPLTQHDASNEHAAAPHVSADPATDAGWATAVIC